MELAQEKRYLLEAFRDEFQPLYGEGHVVFLWHAAFPVVYSSELLYHLWLNFKVFPDAYDGHRTQSIHQLAVADLMLSGLCRSVGSDLYEMDKELRQYCLEKLKTDPRFGQQRLLELSEFLTGFANRFYRSAMHQNLKDVHLMTAMATSNPKAASQQISEILEQAVEKNNNGEILRIHTLIAGLPVKSDAMRQLQTVTGGVKEHVRGNTSHQMLLPVLSEEVPPEGQEILRIPVPKLVRGHIEKKVQKPSYKHLIDREKEERTGTLELIGFSELEIFPKEIFELVWLQELTISRTGLKNVPQALGALKSLQRLTLTFNQIESFSLGENELNHLIELHLSFNKFHTLPSSILGLNSLEVLNLVDNNIEIIPTEIRNLKALKHLNVSGNPLKNPPIEVAGQGIEAIKAYFKELAPTPVVSYTGYEYDVFVSYARQDNAKNDSEDKGWIDQFLEQLEQEAYRQLGHPIKTWFDKKDILPEADFKKTIEHGISHSAISIVFVSPAFLRSSYCLSDLEMMQDSYGFDQLGLEINGRSRVMMVSVGDVDEREVPQFLQSHHRYFFTRDRGELIMPDQREFNSRMIGFSRDLTELLTLIREGEKQDPIPDDNGIPSVFIAYFHKSMKFYEEKVSDELSQNDIETVSFLFDEEGVDDSDYFEHIGDFELVLFLIENHRIKNPSNSWYLRIQRRFFEAAISVNTKCLFWAPFDFELRNWGRAFMKINDTDTVPDLIESSFEELVSSIQDLLEAEDSKVTEVVSHPDVIVDFHPKDRRFAWVIRNYLTENEVTAALNSIEDPDSSQPDQNPLQAKSIVLVNGLVDDFWVNGRINSYLQIIIQNGLPIEEIIVVLAPPAKSVSDSSLKQKFINIKVLDNSSNSLIEPEVGRELLRRLKPQQEEQELIDFSDSGSYKDFLERELNRKRRALIILNRVNLSSEVPDMPDIEENGYLLREALLGLSWHSENISLLHNVTRSTIYKQLRKIENESKEDDQLLFYFGGLSMIKRSKRDDFYLTTTDQDSSESGFSFSLLLEILEDIPLDSIILILDCEIPDYWLPRIPKNVIVIVASNGNNGMIEVNLFSKSLIESISDTLNSSSRYVGVTVNGLFHDIKNRYSKRGQVGSWPIKYGPDRDVLLGVRRNPET